MRSEDIPILQQLANAASGWQTTAQGVGVTITILNVTINGQPVALFWDSTANDWKITAE